MAKKKHIVIGGTGRAGTTLLVRILTRLGLETGFSEDDIARVEVSTARAGLEVKPTRDKADRLPEVIKTPDLDRFLPGALDEGWLDVDVALIPVRDVKAVAKSRYSVTFRSFRQILKKPNRAPDGGIVRARKGPHRQVEHLHEIFFDTIHTLVRYQVPIIFLDFPRFAEDAEYFADAMGPYLKERYGIERERVIEAHRAEVNLDLIRIKNKTKPPATAMAGSSG